MQCYAGGLGLKEGIWLLVLGLGYLVLLGAKKESGILSKIGLGLGTFLVVLSGFLLLSNYLAKAKILSKGCPFKQSLAPSCQLKEQDPPKLDFPVKK